MGIAIRAGRDFNEGDRADAPGVAIVNEALAAGLFGTTNAVGRRFYSGQGQYRREYEVVGIAAASRLAMPGRRAGPSMFLPPAQMCSPQAHLHVRAVPGSAGDIPASIRSALPGPRRPILTPHPA